MRGVNWAAVVVAALVMQAIGFLWYGVIFEQQWIALSGVPAESASNTGMMLGFVNTLVMAVGLGWAVPRMGGMSWGSGAVNGALLAIFFACTTAAMGFIYGGRDTGLIPLEFGYLIVVCLVGGAIIGGLKFGRSASTV
jgi:hypothetical protein